MFKVELIRANLENATTFAKLALQSSEVSEINRYRQKACDAYEEALHELKTATLTQIELESFKTQITYLDVLMECGAGNQHLPGHPSRGRGFSNRVRFR